MIFSSNFNPRSPHGERRYVFTTICIGINISIHAPRTGSDALADLQRSLYAEFQSTLPARGATLFIPTLHTPAIISIHAPRTGSDARVRDAPTRAVVISIHAPRTGSDLTTRTWEHHAVNFNPRSPHGERR